MTADRLLETLRHSKPSTHRNVLAAALRSAQVSGVNHMRTKFSEQCVRKEHGEYKCRLCGESTVSGRVPHHKSCALHGDRAFYG